FVDGGVNAQFAGQVYFQFAYTGRMAGLNAQQVIALAEFRHTAVGARVNVGVARQRLQKTEFFKTFRGGLVQVHKGVADQFQVDNGDTDNKLVTEQADKLKLVKPKAFGQPAALTVHGGAQVIIKVINLFDTVAEQPEGGLSIGLNQLVAAGHAGSLLLFFCRGYCAGRGNNRQ